MRGASCTSESAPASNRVDARVDNKWDMDPRHGTYDRDCTFSSPHYLTWA